MIRIDIKGAEILKSLIHRIPTGNEGEANDLWIHGGVLPIGLSEAVLDQGNFSRFKIKNLTLIKSQKRN
ncbi:hypothetical protein ACFSTE_14605 [Aquimarina hainanensis]|uniref:Uncharacterized protein n=1 Tax=Aquimarina hainanensis TaxID=1578017 RepID=A0ABW5N919_9FLAO|nr:hypothetical protein [Aquimarina sp. TRL1]QKX03583.1 hypothetical protein HN014_01195 [Aquimarina sp. TRL1]